MFSEYHELFDSRQYAWPPPARASPFRDERETRVTPFMPSTTTKDAFAPLDGTMAPSFSRRRPLAALAVDIAGGGPLPLSSSLLRRPVS